MYSKIFVMYPRGVASGGPLALHQLVDEIRRQGGEAFLTPWSGSEERRRVPNFNSYDAPEAQVEDKSENLVVFPEFSLRDSLSISNARTAIWWLSLGNSVPARVPGMLLHITRATFREGCSAAGGLVALLWQELLALSRLWLNSRRRTLHLCQSSYALKLIGGRLRKPAFILGDYIEPASEMTSHKNASHLRALPVISYNPAKVEAWRIEKLKNIFPDVEWLPLERLSSEEVRKTLRNSSVYLDLGYFPGKDRLPRESIMVGTPVVIAFRGAGKNEGDFPLPKSAKVKLGVGWLERTRKALELVLIDRESALEKQHDFRQSVSRERELFSIQVEKLLRHPPFSSGP